LTQGKSISSSNKKITGIQSTIKALQKLLNGHTKEITSLQKQLKAETLKEA